MQSKKVNQENLYRLVNALGIRHVGVKIAKSLTRTYDTMDKLMNASLESLCMKDDIGQIIAESIYNFFREEQTIDLINRLKDYGVNMEAQKEETADDRFYGINIRINRKPRKILKRTSK